MEKQTSAKLITCVLKKSLALPLMEGLSEKGISKINFAFARGSELQDDGSSKLKEEEKEIVTIVADSPEQAEDLFDFVYDKAEIGKPGSGLIYMTTLHYTTPYKVQS